MYYFRKFLLYTYILFLTLGVNSVRAQGIRKGRALSELGRSSNLSQINVDLLSDAEIAAMWGQFQASGASIEQAEQAALSKGMTFVEWQKLKARATQTGKTDQKVSTEPVAIPTLVREEPKDTYRTYEKAATPNVFGSFLFTTASLSFEPNLRIATPLNYILGPDDELLVNVSGYQETNIRTSVQPEGSIFIPQVGTIAVNGLTVEQATARIRDRMSQTAYPSIRGGQSRLLVSLGKIRSIHVTIIGGAKPGNYTISSLSTVFNSLFLCGGPGEINSYRNIELIRNNKVYQRIDLYQFLTRGDQKGNIPLRESDVINFPVYKKRVTISGEVKRPQIFELKEGETLNDLLFFAGGFTEKAYKASIKVKQITDTDKKIKDIPKSELSGYYPSNGDEFQIDAVLDRFENAVSIEGAVYRPGQFELTPGLSVKALIDRAGGLQESVFTNRATLTRSYSDGRVENITFSLKDVVSRPEADIQLIKRDVVTVAAAPTFRDNYTVQIQGEVRKPGQYAFKENLSLKDLLFASGGFTEAATPYNIEVGRRIVSDVYNSNVDSISRVYTLNTERGLGIENDKFILQPYDIVTIRRNPSYVEQKQVTLNGEVNYPGTYTILSKSERLSNLFKRAGGITPLANVKGVFLIRKNLQTDTINQRNVKDIQSGIRDTSSKVMYDISRENNRIAVNLKQVMNKPGSVNDYVLQNGDIIEVLKLDPLVRVNGEVLSATTTAHVKNKRLSYYITRAGGTTDMARKSKIYVVYANGNAKRTHSFLFGIFKAYPPVNSGSEIVIPRKKERKNFSTGEIIGLTSGITSLVSLIIVTITSLK